MKKYFRFQSVILIIGIMLISCIQKSEPKFYELNDSYLGQKQPGMIPEIFVPGLISTKEMEHSSVIISPENGDIYFVRKIGETNTIFYSTFENDKYTQPQIVSFSGKYFDGAPAFSADGKRLFFGSRRPLHDTILEQKDFDIWMVDKTSDGWGIPVNLGAPVNTDALEIGQCIASDGSLYFSSNREGGKGKFDIYMSRFVNGEYIEPENLGDAINTEHHESSPCISPNGNFLLFDVYGREEGNGIYISYKKENGEWGDAFFLGSEINETGTERFSNFSPDGKFLFFNSMRKIEGNDSTQYGNGLGDIYWVNTKIIDNLKPEEL